jgi:amidase
MGMMGRRGLMGGAAAMMGAGMAAAQASGEEALCYASVDELRTIFRRGRTTPLDVLEAQIRRIEALNPRVNCITDTHFEVARAEARQAAERYARGDARPLEGITVAMKDEFARPGWRITQGSLLFKDSPPATENAALTDALEAAGAIFPFQTTVPELYLFAGASTRAWGTTRNPWNLEYSPGGSSAGSGAALAAGFATLATGSDMGGSIRIPASQNGLYGFRPPFGRVASGETAFSTSGPLARSFGDLVHFQNAITGPSEKVMSAMRPALHYPMEYPGIEGWRIAVDWASAVAECIPSVRAAMQAGLEALRRAGCVVEEVDCGFRREQKLTFVRALLATSIGTLVEAANARRDLLSPYMAEMLDLAGPLGPRQVEEGETLLQDLHRQVQRRVFGQGYRVLLMPTMATPLVPADMFQSHAAGVEPWTATGLASALTWHWNLLNRYPVLDVPLGLAAQGMPTGMQVIGQSFTDLDCFQFGASWARLNPPLFSAERFPRLA